MMNYAAVIIRNPTSETSDCTQCSLLSIMMISTFVFRESTPRTAELNSEECLPAGRRQRGKKVKQPSSVPDILFRNTRRKEEQGSDAGVKLN